MLRRRRADTALPLPPQQPNATRNASAIDPAQTQQVPTQCPSGHYCPGGVHSGGSAVMRCPNGLWTQSVSASTASECCE
jgi:hypothetical protein